MVLVVSLCQIHFLLTSQQLYRMYIERGLIINAKVIQIPEDLLTETVHGIFNSWLSGSVFPLSLEALCKILMIIFAAALVKTPAQILY